MRILSKLNQAEAFETFLQTKYVGQKRFSLEGGESSSPCSTRSSQGAAEARPRRGRDRHGAPRPTQRAHEHRRQDLRPDLPRVRGRPRPADLSGSGDVKYHLGTEGTFVADGGKEIPVYLAANP